MSKKSVMLIVVGVLLVFGFSKLMKGTAQTSGDATPTMSAGAVEIVPASAFTNTTLSVRRVGVRGTDAGVSSCAWYRNGVEISGATDPTLDPSQFRKGDEIVAEAVIKAGESARRSQPVTIGGMRPQVSAVVLTYDESSAKIHAKVAARDVDGDELTYRYTWFRNNDEIPGETGTSLSVSGFRNGDRIHASVTAFDGTVASAPIAGAPVVLGSDAPAITSTPPQTAEGGRYVYQVMTTAHDPGSLAFELVDAPEGMAIDANGRIEWSLPQEQVGEQSYNVVVRVSHTSGAETTQRFSIGTAPRDATASSE